MQRRPGYHARFRRRAWRCPGGDTPTVSTTLSNSKRANCGSTEPERSKSRSPSGVRSTTGTAWMKPFRIPATATAASGHATTSPRTTIRVPTGNCRSRLLEGVGRSLQSTPSERGYTPTSVNRTTAHNRVDSHAETWRPMYFSDRASSSDVTRHDSTQPRDIVLRPASPS